MHKCTIALAPGSTPKLGKGPGITFSDACSLLIQAQSQDFCKGGCMSVCCVCRMYNNARLGWSGAVLPQDILEIAYEAILGQKQSCSNSIRYMAHRELLLLNIMKHTNIGACERYSYKEVEFTNTINNYIKFRLLKAMNVSGMDIMNNLTTESFVVIINSGVV